MKKTNKGTAAALAAAILVSGGGVATLAAGTLPAQASVASVTNPSPVTGVKVGTTTYTMDITWAQPTQKVTDWHVEIWDSTKTELVDENYFETPTAVFSGLQPNTKYWAKVTPRVFDSEGNEFRGTSVFVSGTTQVESNDEGEWDNGWPDVSMVTGLTAKAASPTKVDVSWNPATTKNGIFLGYSVEVTNNTTKKVQTLSPTPNPRTVTNLSFAATPNTSYTVSVYGRAISEDETIIASGVSSTVTVKTPALAPSAVAAPKGPTSLKASSVTYNSANLSWTTPASITGKLTSYTVTLKQAGKADRVFTTTATSYKLTGLAQNTSYTAQVKANVVSSDGKAKVSSPSASLAVKTPYSPSVVKSAAPVGLNVSTTYSSVTPSWKTPTVVGKVKNYVVQVKQGTKVVKSHTVSATAKSFAVTGLKENTKYTVVVTTVAVSPDGKNTASSAATKLVTTKFSPASTVAVGKVTSIKVTPSKSSNTIGLSWKKPAVTGKITSYTVTVKQGTKTVKTYTNSANSLSRTVTGLKSKSSYKLEIRANAVSSNGKYKASSAAVTVNVRT